MQQITTDMVSYRIDGQSVYLNSGEFHYFRVPKQDWEYRMRLFKEAGGNCVATYIPWLLHEPEEGKFVFGGTDEDGMLDLESFLQTAQKCGLYVIARPGPYQYSELKYNGLPSWLCENYPELMAKRLDGGLIDPSSISYLHPLYLEKVKTWFAAVCPILTKYTVSNGGPIAYTQFDNELTGIHMWFYGLDYNWGTMGFGLENGRYSRFLKQRYESLGELNAAYGTTYTSFAGVMPTGVFKTADEQLIRRRKDYADFYLNTVADYAVFLCGEMRRHGIDTPFVHNSANPNMNAYFLETVEALKDEEFVLGSDHYYNLGPRWEHNNPTPQYAVKVFYSNEMLRLMGFPPTVFELPSGSCSDWPPILPEDSMACYMVNLAYGMKGHNYYIYTGGPNPPGAGLTTDIYDYGAPIGPNNEIRPLYEIQKKFAQFIQSNGWLNEASLVADFRVALDFEYVRSGLYWPEPGEFAYSNDQAWRFLQKGLLTSAFCGGLSPEMIRLDAEDWVKETALPLVVASSVSMSAAKQERLVRYVMNGGSLLIAPVVPTLDENLMPCTILADFLGAKPLRRHELPLTRATVGKLVNIRKDQLFYSDELPDGAEQLGVEEFTGATVAWQKKMEASGQVIWLGLEWEHAMREQEQLVVALLTGLGMSQRVTCSLPQVWTALRSDGRQAMLFAMNLHSSPAEAELSLVNAAGTKLEIGAHLLPAMTVIGIPVSVEEWNK